jgi:uncharacterized membrane protein
MRTFTSIANLKAPVRTRLTTVLAELERSAVFQLLLLSAITLLAIFLRFYKLGQWSFWGDEYITIRRALTILDTGSYTPKISLLATYMAMNKLGISEWSARLTAATIGVLSVPVLYFLIRKMFDPGVALLASLLLSISQWHIYWSQNARFYTPLLLFYTLALLLFYFGLEEDRPWYLIFSLGFLGLAMLERLVAAFFIPVAGSYILLLKWLPFAQPPGLRLRNLALLAVPGLIGGVLIALTDPSVRNPAQWFTSFGFVNNDPLWIFAGLIFYLGIPLVCMSALAAVYLLQKQSRAGLLLSLAAIIPVLGILGISLVQYTANRYVFVSLTSFTILAGVAAKELWRLMRPNGKILAFGALLILFLAPLGDDILYYQFQNGNRDNWKDAFAFIGARKQPDDLVVTTHTDLAKYYLQERTIGMPSANIDRIVANKQRAWFVLDLTAPKKAPEVYRWVRANAQEVANLDVTVSARTFPMRIYLYDPAQAPYTIEP